MQQGNLNMMKTMLLILIVTGMGLTACAQSNGEAVSGSDFAIMNSDIDWLLKKNSSISSVESERLLKQFVEQNAIAELIYQDKNVDWSKANAEIKAFRNDILVKYYIDSLRDKEFSDDDLQKYYKEHLPQYSENKLRLAHIFIRLHPRLSQAQVDEKKRKADHVLELLGKGGEFSALVREYSEDILSVDQDGDLGWISNRDSRNTLYEAGLKLKVGAVSQILETERGLHIVKLLEAPINRITAFEDVKEKIRYKLQYDSRIAAMQRLKEKAATRINKDLAVFMRQVVAKQ